MPAETGKMAHVAHALKRVIFAQRSQFFFSTVDVLWGFVWPCCGCNSMLFLQQLEEDFLPVESSFEPDVKVALL